MKITHIVGLLFILFYISIYAQDENYQVGGTLNRLNSPQAAFYDYSDPSAVNIKVDVWGFVKFPGKYIIPSYSKVNDLLSYAGGPTDAARMEDLRVLRTLPDSTQKIINLDYKDLLFDNSTSIINPPPPVLAGDVLIVSGSPRFYFKDYLATTLSIVSVLISIIILVKR